MTSSRRSKIFWLLVIGLGFICIAWLAESALFMDLGAHSTNNQAFEVIKSAVVEGKFSNLKGDSEIHNAALWVANDASRAVMSSVRHSRSFSMWLYAIGVLLILAGFVLVVRTPVVAVLDAGE